MPRHLIWRLIRSVIAAQVIGALQTLASRRIKPGTPFVLTIGTIRGGVSEKKRDRSLC